MAAKRSSRGVVVVLAAVWCARSAVARRRGEAAEEREVNYYRVLGVPRQVRERLDGVEWRLSMCGESGVAQASSSQIRRAFHEKALVLHPDKRCARQRGKCDRRRVNSEFARASEAFEALRDPERRAEYDARLAAEVMSPVGMVVDWVVAKSPLVRRGLVKLRRRWARRLGELRSPARAAALALRSLAKVGERVRERWRADRVYEAAFAGIARYDGEGRPTLVAAYSSSRRSTAAVVSTGVAFRRLCAATQGLFECRVLDCAVWARHALCARLSWWDRLVAAADAKFLVLSDDEVVDLGPEPRDDDALAALMASRDRVVRDIRRPDALRAFLDIHGRAVVALTDSYEPSMPFVALAREFRSIAFAEARASNTKLWDALALGRGYRFPKFVLLAPPADDAVFDRPADLRDFLAAFLAATPPNDDHAAASDDPLHRNASAPLPSRADLEAMSGADLRRLVDHRRLRCVGCLEKADFLHRLLADAASI